VYPYLKDAMKENGLSANRLALKSEISPSDLSQALNGKKPFFPGWRKRISQVLRTSEEILFPEYEPKEV